MKNLNLKIEREGDLDCLNAVIKMREEKLDMNVDMWGTEAQLPLETGPGVSMHRKLVRRIPEDRLCT